MHPGLQRSAQPLPLPLPPAALWGWKAATFHCFPPIVQAWRSTPAPRASCPHRKLTSMLGERVVAWTAPIAFTRPPARRAVLYSGRGGAAHSLFSGAETLRACLLCVVKNKLPPAGQQPEQAGRWCSGARPAHCSTHCQRVTLQQATALAPCGRAATPLSAHLSGLARRQRRPCTG